jgi:hypothetical protein
MHFFLAVWIWQEGIVISWNGRICILVIFFLNFWSLYETQKRQSILALPKHFEVTCQALDISFEHRKSDFRVMVALIRQDDGTIQHIDSHLLYFLGYSGWVKPRNICEIITDNLRSIAIMGGSNSSTRPDDKNHTALSSIYVKRRDGGHEKMAVTINRLSDAIAQFLFVPHANPADSPTTTKPRSDVPARVSVNDQLSHDEAFVMLMDIMGYTAACSRLSSTEVLAWMGRVRRIVDGLLAEHAMQLIETRGDSVLALTAAADGPAPASRAVLCAAAIAAALHEQERTSVRVGVAAGPATVATLRCAHCRDALLLFGDVANVAGRLEQVPPSPPVPPLLLL